MVFRNSPRVLYRTNPLEQVVCKLNFPPILRISSEQPAGFQDRIRSAFPLLRERPAVEVPDKIPPQLAQLVAANAGRVYDFLSRDEVWTVSLFREFLALSTSRYQRWEDFREHLRSPLESLIELYQPNFFSRIGLRYINVIQRGKLGLESTAWSDLLSQAVSAELADPDLHEFVERAAHEILINLSNGGKVQLSHGFAPGEGDDQAYVLDADFFTETPVEPNDAIKQLDAFNSESGRLFRWAIKDRLHEAMGPQDLPQPV